MMRLTAENYRKVYADLLLYRRERLEQLLAGEVHVEMCEALHEKLEAAMLTLDAKAVNDVPQLADRHNLLTRGMALRLEGDASDPMVEPERRAAARRLKVELVDGRRGGGVSASERANHAYRVRSKRAKFAPDLARVAPEIEVLFDEWLDVGDAIDRAMSKRHEPIADGRQPLAEIVLDAQRGISKLRRAVQALRDVQPNLPSVFEEQLLGYFFALAQPRKRPTKAPEAEARPGVQPRDGEAAQVSVEETTPVVASNKSETYASAYRAGAEAPLRCHVGLDPTHRSSVTFGAKMAGDLDPSLCLGGGLSGAHCAEPAARLIGAALVATRAGSRPG